MNGMVKRLGTFSGEQSVIQVSMELKEHTIRADDRTLHRIAYPEGLLLVDQGAEFRIPMENLEGFVGMLTGYLKEFQQQRTLALRDIERLGGKISDVR